MSLEVSKEQPIVHYIDSISENKMSLEVNTEKPIIHYLDSFSERNFRLAKMFPSDTKIIHYEASSDKNYTATLRLRCSSKEDFKVWLAEFERLSNSKYRVLKTIPRAGKTVIYKATYRCERNTYPDSHRGRLKKPSKKNTDCCARLSITIKSSVKERRCRSKDFLRSEYPSIVIVRHCHNHDMGRPTTVKHKNQNEDTQKNFIICSPGKTIDIHESNLIEEFEEDSCGATDDLDNYSDSDICDVNVCDKSTIKLKYLDEVVEKQIEWKDIELKWNNMKLVLEQKFLKNPTDFACAIDSMYSQFISLDDDSLISAMYSFGEL